MKKLIKYSDRILELKTFNINTDRDLILYSGEENKNIDELLYIVSDYYKCNIDNDKLTEDEKYFILYKLRELSVSNEIEIITTCPHCGYKNNREISTNNILKPGTIDHPKLRNIISDDDNDYILDLDSLELDEYDELLEYIETHKTTFNLTQNVNCFQCEKEFTVNLKNLDLLASVMSSAGTNVLGFYDSITTLVFSGKFDFNGILNMYPYEKDIYIARVNTIIEKQNEELKKNQKK